MEQLTLELDSFDPTIQPIGLRTLLQRTIFQDPRAQILNDSWLKCSTTSVHDFFSGGLDTVLRARHESRKSYSTLVEEAMEKAQSSGYSIMCLEVTCMTPLRICLRVLDRTGIQQRLPIYLEGDALSPRSPMRELCCAKDS